MAVICHNSASKRLITTEFGRQMQNNMPMTTRIKIINHVKRSQLYSETESSIISAMNSDYLSKFCMKSISIFLNECRH